MRNVVLAMNTTVDGRLNDPFAWFNRRMAKKQNSYKKYVFSRSAASEPLAWNNSELVMVGSDRDIVEFVRSLKEQPGADIHLAGGARLAQAFVRLGLVDELRFFVHPVFSPGEPWFGMLDELRHLELVSVTPFENGAVALYYRPTDALADDDDRSGADLWATEPATAGTTGRVELRLGVSGQV